MSWSIVGLGTLTIVSSGNLTLDEHANTAQGDLVIACICFRSNVAFTLPDANWNLVDVQLSNGDTDATQGVASGLMAYYIRGASPPSFAFARTGGDLGYGRTITYRGNTASPYDTGRTEQLGTIGHPSLSAISTAEANELLVGMVAHGDNSTTSNWNATDPGTGSGSIDESTNPTVGTWIERQDSGTNTGADGGLFIVDAVKSSSGSTGTFSATAQTQTNSVTIVGAFKMTAETTKNIVQCVIVNA